MKYGTFAKLYQEAALYSDVEMYIGERGWQEWMNECSEDKDAAAQLAAEAMVKIFRLAKLSLAQIRTECLKISKAEMARTYQIPLRTLENWEADKRELRDYTLTLIAYTVFMEEQ